MSQPSSTSLNVPLADVILLSCEGTQYRMAKATLAHCSPFFKHMFSLPQPVDPQHDFDVESGLPVIALTEPAEVLDVLLQFCLPHAPPLAALDNLAFTLLVLDGARKYELEWAFSSACDALKRIAEHEPVKVYAAACHYRFEDVARQAALFCLRVSLSDIFNTDTADLAGLSAGQLARLLKYRHACADAVTGHIASRDWVDAYCAPFDAVQQRSLVWRKTCCGNSLSRRDSAGQQRWVQTWWEKYVRESVARLSVCTWAGTLHTMDVIHEFMQSRPCAACCAVAVSQLDGIVQRMALEVKEQISKASSPSANGVHVRCSQPR
jgi:hypothetical protein